MGFVMAALSSTTFLCGAIVVTAAVAMLTDVPELASGRFVLHPGDIADLALVLLVARFLHCTEGNDHQARGLITGLLFVLAMMLSIMYVFSPS